MKKILMTAFICFSFVSLANTAEETADLRKYHIQLEEKVFELEEGETRDEKVRESFLHGKRRIEDAIKNEKVDLEAEGKDTSEKLEELYILQEKYNKVLEEYNNLSEEKEKLLLENKSYQEKIQKGMK